MKYSQVAKQFFIFSIIGVLGLFVNILLYTFLNGMQIIVNPILANIIATSLTILFNWILNRIWTFKSSKNVKEEVIKFFIASSLALPINALTLYVMREIVGFDALFTDNISIVIGTAIGMLIKFTLYKFWVFKVKD